MNLDSKRKRPPALVITALAPWRMTRLMESGVGYMRKPLNSDLLLSTIKTLLSKDMARVNEH